MSFALLPLLITNPQTIADEIKEIETKNKLPTPEECETLLNGGDLTNARQDLSDKNKNNQNLALQMANTLKNEFIIIFKNLNILAIATGSNVVAMAFNTATADSATSIFHDPSFEALSLWFIAIIISALTIWSTIYFGKKVNKSEKRTYEFILENDLTTLNARSYLLWFAIKRQSVQIMCNMLSYSMAWAVQTAIQYTINGLFHINSDEGTSVAGVTSSWIYVTFVTLLVTVIRSENKQYYFCYPRHKYISLQPKSIERKLAADVISMNLLMIVGVAFHNAIQSSVLLGSNSIGAAVLTYWIIVVIVVVGTVFLQFIWIKFQYTVLGRIKKQVIQLREENKKKKLVKKQKKEEERQKKKRQRSLTNDSKENNNNNYNGVNDAGNSNNDNMNVTVDNNEDVTPNISVDIAGMNITSIDISNAERMNRKDDNENNDNKLPDIEENEEEEEEYPDDLWYIFINQLVTVIIAALGIAGSNCVGDALQQTISLIYGHVKYKGSQVISAWVAWFIALCFAVFLMTYLSVFFDQIQKQRKLLMDRLTLLSKKVVSLDIVSKTKSNSNDNNINNTNGGNKVENDDKKIINSVDSDNNDNNTED